MDYGYPVDYFDKSPRTFHTLLPRANGDNGNTPSGIGSLLAQSYGHDTIAYLDTDNGFQPQHVENLVKAHLNTGAGPLTCMWTFHDLEGNDLRITEPEEDERKHVGTSCVMLFRP